MDISITDLDDFILRFIENKMPPFSVINKYRESLKVSSFCKKIDADVIDSIENSIIFIADKPNYTFLRQSLSLKNMRLKTILLTRWAVKKEERDFYDQVILYDKFQDLKLLSRCKGCIFYVHAWIWWSFLPVYIDLIVDEDVYCNINDLVHIAPDESVNFYLNMFGKEYVEMGFQCEKYILDNFPIVTLQNYSKSLFRHNLGKYKIKKNNILAFQCYPCTPFLQKKERKLTNNVELLYLGGISPDNFPDAGFGAGKFNHVVNRLLHDDLYISFFLNPGALNSAIIGDSPHKLEKRHPVLTDLAKLNDQFTLQQGYFPWELSEHCEKFHFGLMVYCCNDAERGSLIINNMLPSKLFTYLEIGLPVIVMEGTLAVSDFVRSNGVGIVISESEISNLQSIINQHRDRYPLYIENIRKYCSENNMDKMIQTIFPQ